MENYIVDPKRIEEKSFEMITEEMKNPNLEPFRLSIVQRVIHTTTDFIYEDILWFKEGVEFKMLEAFKKGNCTIITDTNMIKSGISKALCDKLNIKLECFVSDSEVAKTAKLKGITRSMAGMDHAATLEGSKILAIGNAPTAVYRAIENIEAGKMTVEGIIGAPVGFVGAEESKDYLWEKDIPSIIVKGRKGGSTIVVAIINAVLREAVKQNNAQ